MDTYPLRYAAIEAALRTPPPVETTALALASDSSLLEAIETGLDARLADLTRVLPLDDPRTEHSPYESPAAPIGAIRTADICILVFTTFTDASIHYVRENIDTWTTHYHAVYIYTQVVATEAWEMFSTHFSHRGAGITRPYVQALTAETEELAPEFAPCDDPRIAFDPQVAAATRTTPAAATRSVGQKGPGPRHYRGETPVKKRWQQREGDDEREDVMNP